MGACFSNGKLAPMNADFQKQPGWAISDSDDSDEDPLVRLKRMIKTVDIDRDGVFKYIQICVKPRVENNPCDTEVVVVRGFLGCTYHADILTKFEQELTADDVLNINWQAECIGGGRIAASAAEMRVQIYGRSEGFGRANHEVTHKLISQALPSTHKITWSNEGQ